MSGHSHWKTIKYKKGALDTKRGRIFSKLSRLITAAAKHGGADPAFNPRLKLAVEQARSFNMPGENIERALKRAEGTGTEETLEELLLEGFGPGGMTCLIFAITDNKNRTLGEIRQVLIKYGGKLGEGGSVKWLFDQRGVIRTPIETRGGMLPEELEMRAIDAGALDILRQQDAVEIFVEPEDVERIKNTLSESGIQTEAASVEWIAKNYIKLPREKQDAAEFLLNELDDLEDVQDVYTNVAFD